MADAREDRRDGTVARIAKKLLMPLVATAVSAATSYAAKRGPELFEQKLLPRLRGLVDESGRAAGAVPDRAKSTLSSAGDLAEGLTERVRAAADGAGSTHTRRSVSPQQRERERAERARGREARRRRPRS